MKLSAACLLVALASAPASAMAQAVADSTDKLRTCSTLPTPERAKCLDLLSREVGQEPAARQAASGANGAAAQESWVVSATTSPLDYSPVVVATATAGGAPNASGMKLTIACRGGSVSLTLSGTGAFPGGDRYAVSYAVDGGSPKTVPAVPSPSGAGVVLGGDIFALLRSLPASGEISFRIVGSQNPTLEGHYSLAGLMTTRERVAAACRWPTTTAVPRK